MFHYKEHDISIDFYLKSSIDFMLCVSCRKQNFKSFVHSDISILAYLAFTYVFNKQTKKKQADCGDDYKFKRYSNTFYKDSDFHISFKLTQVIVSLHLETTAVQHAWTV